MTRFSWFGELQGLGGASQNQFEWAVLLRVAVLVWCLVAWIRREPEPIVIEPPALDDGPEAVPAAPRPPPLPA